VLGDHPREERSAERLAASLHRADEKRQREELPRGGHEVAEDADAGIDGEREEDGGLGADPAGQGAEQERERHADELHEHECRDAGVAVDADLGAVDGGHADDRLDAVVVEEKGHQHEERLPVAAQLLEGFAKPGEGRRDRVVRRRLVALEAPRRLGDAAEERNREGAPPDRHADERQLDGRQRVGQPEGGRHQNPEQVDDEEEAAAEIPHGVGGGRHAIHFVGRRDVGQQRVVEDEARGNGEVRHHEQRGGRLPLAAIDRRHQERRRDAEGHEGAEHRLLDAAHVGNGAQDRSRNRNQRHGDGRRPGEARGRRGGREIGRGDAGEEIRKDRRDHRRLKRGVRPVVHRPRAQLGTMQAETVQNGGGLGLWALGLGPKVSRHATCSKWRPP
jgi:hypothetical protein